MAQPFPFLTQFSKSFVNNFSFVLLFQTEENSAFSYCCFRDIVYWLCIRFFLGFLDMSMVPLSFRDWWDDFDRPFRSSRLLDQEFGTGLRRDDLLSSMWSGQPSLLRSGYIRPWRQNNLKRESSGSTLNVDSDKFQVILDVQQFTPNEITVKTTDKFVVVEGKHEEKADEHG